jgi:hypothetical protein
MTACTEKEAAEKWCPHMRKAIADVDCLPSNMADDGDFSSTCCIGSRCMQWRWFDQVHQIVSLSIKPQGNGWEDCGPAFASEGATRCWSRLVPDDERRGYCGLAGKP